jgi:hypothetical protein
VGASFPNPNSSGEAQSIRKPGIVRKTFADIANAGVNAIAVAQGSSELVDSSLVFLSANRIASIGVEITRHYPTWQVWTI